MVKLEDLKPGTKIRCQFHEYESFEAVILQVNDPVKCWLPLFPIRVDMGGLPGLLTIEEVKQVL